MDVALWHVTAGRNVGEIPGFLSLLFEVGEDTSSSNGGRHRTPTRHRLEWDSGLDLDFPDTRDRALLEGPEVAYSVGCDSKLVRNDEEGEEEGPSKAGW